MTQSLCKECCILFFKSIEKGAPSVSTDHNHPRAVLLTVGVGVEINQTRHIKALPDFHDSCFNNFTVRNFLSGKKCRNKDKDISLHKCVCASMACGYLGDVVLILVS